MSLSGCHSSNISPRDWRSRWKSVSDGQGGGQADVKHVVASDGSDGTIRFLKVLRHQNDMVRRGRMYREVAAYRTLLHPGIPKLIDTNVEQFEDLGHKLYLVTEFIPGGSLAEHIDRLGPLPLADCLSLVTRLSEIVEYCHCAEVVHRDIKPDNIMLRGGASQCPILVDFGLSFNRAGENTQNTLSSMELGNRFLRLPELSPGSPSNRDTRSDVTFCAAILLYVATGQMPAVLIDEHGKLPHQRPAIRLRLEKLCGPRQLGQLMTLFDKGFQSSMPHRWQSAGDFRKKVVQIAAGEATAGPDIDSLRAEISEYCEGETLRNRGLLAKQLDEALSRIQEIAYRVRGAFSIEFSSSHTGYEVDPMTGHATTSIALMPNGHSPSGYIKFHVSVVGGELVFSSKYRNDESPFYRTSLESPNYDATFEKEVESLLLSQVRNDLRSI